MKRRLLIMTNSVQRKAFLPALGENESSIGGTIGFHRPFEQFCSGRETWTFSPFGQERSSSQLLYQGSGFVDQQSKRRSSAAQIYYSTSLGATAPAS